MNCDGVDNTWNFLYFQDMFSSRKRFAITFWTAYLVLVPFFMYKGKKTAYENSEKREATVIDHIPQRRGHYYPQFQFTYDDSTYVSEDKLIWTSGSEIGEKLTVIFPKGQPEQAIIYTFVSYWIYFPLLAISFMICFFVFAMIVIIKWEEGYSMFR